MAGQRITQLWQKLCAYGQQSRRPVTGALAIIPLLLLYGLGRLRSSANARSGVDFITDRLLNSLDVEVYVAVICGTAVVMMAGCVWQLRSTLWRRSLLVVPIVGESLVYAALFGGTILTFMEELKLLTMNGAGPMSWFDHAVMSAGAGLNEEILFRLMLIPALLLLAERSMAMPRMIAIIFAVGVSSVAFAGAHHLAGEPYDSFTFIYRSLAGFGFATLYLTRGIGVAVWTHALYDLYALTLQG